MSNPFAQARRAGFDVGVSTAMLTRVMVDVFLRLPVDAPPSKEIVVQGLGILGQAAKTRDINAAWDSAKRQVARDHPEQFCLDGKVLRLSAVADRPREKLSAAGHRRLATLAAKEGVSPDELLGRLVLAWRRSKK
jgi:hypothetical protein